MSFFLAEEVFDDKGKPTDKFVYRCLDEACETAHKTEDEATEATRVFLMHQAQTIELIGIARQCAICNAWVSQAVRIDSLDWQLTLCQLHSDEEAVAKLFTTAEMLSCRYTPTVASED